MELEKLEYQVVTLVAITSSFLPEGGWLCQLGQTEPQSTGGCCRELEAHEEDKAGDLHPLSSWFCTEASKDPKSLSWTMGMSVMLSLSLLLTYLLLKDHSPHQSLV